MTLTGPTIKSKELNDSFGNFKTKGLAQDEAGETDDGLLGSLRFNNQSNANHSNIVLNWNYIYFMSDGAETYDTERNDLHYRAPDDLQILAVIPDLWGVDRIGYNAQTAGISGPSSRLLIHLTVKGNFTKLDEESGLPVIYKSSEFNLVTDIEMVLDLEDSAILNRTNASVTINPVKTLGPNVLSGRGTDPSSTQIVNGFPRKLYYPFDENEPLFTLIRGAPYIFTISFTDLSGQTLIDASTRLANHPITSVQMSLVTRSFRRRYA